MPISWQGWAVTIVYALAVLALAVGLDNRSPLAVGAAVALPTIIFLVIAAKTTRGGWRWRWGDED